MLKSISAISKFVLGELFYTSCHFCGRRTDAPILCGKCYEFSECRHSLPSNHPSFIDKVESLYWLDDNAKDLLHRAKYFKQPMYLDAFKESVLSLRKSNVSNEVVIPMPLSLERYLERTFNQSWIIAGWVVKGTGRCLLYDALLKTNETKAQAKLSKKDRQQNLKGSFEWNPKIAIPDSVLLIDDVTTTGATLEECARVLKKAGVGKVTAWTLFRTPDVHGATGS